MADKLIEFHKTRDFSNKISVTIDFIKQNYKPLFKSLLYISGPLVILGGLLFTQVYTGYVGILIRQTQGGFDSALGDLTNMGLMMAAGLVFVVLGSTAVIATVNEYMILYEAKKGEPITVTEVWMKVKATFLTVLGTIMLYSVGLIISYLLILSPVLFLQGSIFLSSLFILLGGIGLIYVAITMSMIFIVRAYENVGFSTAVGRCFYLIKEKWWSTFALLFVASLVRGLISSIFFIPWYISMFVRLLHLSENQSFEEPSLLSQIFDQSSLLLYFISSVILYCIPLIAIAFQYFNLVERKESRGLMSKIESFGAGENKDDDEEHY